LPTSIVEVVDSPALMEDSTGPDKHERKKSMQEIVVLDGHSTLWQN
jgi:hypothetical protein